MNQSDNENMNPILFMSIGSIAAIVLFLTLNSLSVLSVLGLLLIPILFAYPIIKEDPKLLFIEQSGFNFTSYNLIFSRTDGRNSIWVEVQAEHINDDLTELIEYMQKNLDERGSYYDAEKGLHYTD